MWSIFPSFIILDVVLVSMRIRPSHNIIMIFREPFGVFNVMTILCLLYYVVVSASERENHSLTAMKINRGKRADLLRRIFPTHSTERKVLEKILTKQSQEDEVFPDENDETDTDIDVEKADPENPEWNYELKNRNHIQFFEGDIRLDPITRLKLEVEKELKPRQRRAVKKSWNSRWINGTVPYLINRQLPHRTRKEIRKAIRHWRRKTCLRFRAVESKDVDYIHFVSDEGCWSNVGRLGGEQKISIGQGCNQMGTIIHEIGHAVGFWHEQSRRDRDAYIRIIKENIQEDQRDQFRRVPAELMDSMGFAYDYWSIMHYGPRFFSKNKRPTIKIRKIGRRVGAQIGQRRGLSRLDIAQIRAMYNCNKKTTYPGGCFQSQMRNGRDYRGSLDYSETGVTCQHWDSQWPHRHREDLSNPFDGLGSHNKCRNPGGRRKRPWCYTTLTAVTWQYCDVPIC